MNDGLEQGVAVHPNHLPDLRYVLNVLHKTRGWVSDLDGAHAELGVAINDMAYIIKRTEEAAAIPPVKAQGEATGAAWKMVPAEPTPKMLFEADKILAGEPRILSALYRAMISAALPPVAGAAGTVGEPVTDAVWEALQRLIENAASLGPSSQEDAMVVARWRGQFVAVRERATLPPTPPAAGTVPIEAGGVAVTPKPCQAHGEPEQPVELRCCLPEGHPGRHSFLVRPNGVALGANASPDYTDEPWQDALLARAVAAGFKRDAHGDWIVPGGLDTTELLALLSGLPLPERYTRGVPASGGGGNG